MTRIAFAFLSPKRWGRIDFRSTRIVVWLLAAITFHSFTYAQESAADASLIAPILNAHAITPAPMSAATTDSRWGHRQPLDDAQEEAETRRRTLGIILGNSLAVALYGKRNWWQDGFHSGFRSVKEGWFGQNTYSGGADKLGHFYMNYAGTRLFARAFDWAGNTPEKSLEMAGWLMLGTFTAVEVLDGYSKQWRFSREDVFMNAAGIGAALLLEKNPTLDRLIDLRFLYQSSSGRGFEPFGDYSGQTYLVVAKASGVPGLQTHPLLRYLELAVGYGSRGYASHRTGGTDERARNVYVGISLNLSEVLNATVFKSSREERRAQRVTDTVLEFVQVPGTAVFTKHQIGTD